VIFKGHKKAPYEEEYYFRIMKYLLLFTILFCSLVVFGQNEDENYYSITVKSISFEEAIDTLVVNGFDVLSHNDYTLHTDTKLVKFNSFQAISYSYIVTKLPFGVRFSVIVHFAQPVGPTIIGSKDYQNKHIPKIWKKLEDMTSKFNSQKIYNL
jgi:hypothetical protein